MNLLDDISSKFRTKNWIKINDDSRGTYNANSQIKFKTIILKSGLCDYSYAYSRLKGTITNTGAEEEGTSAQKQTIREVHERNKAVIFKNCVPVTNCISEIKPTHVDNAKDIDVVMSTNNLIEYIDNYSKTSGSLFQYYR